MTKKRPAPKLDAARVRDRLQKVISDLYGGDRQLMEKKCGLEPNTVKGWFGAKPVVPSLALLAQVADRADVSLDWFVLGRGRMEWHLVGRAQLLAEVRSALTDRLWALYRLHADTERPGRALDLLAEVDPDLLWKELMEYAIHSLEERADEARES